MRLLITVAVGLALAYLALGASGLFDPPTMPTDYGIANRCVACDYRIGGDVRKP